MDGTIYAKLIPVYSKILFKLKGGISMRKFTPSVVLVLLIPILLLGLTLIYAQEQPKAPETPQAQETIKAPETPTPPQEAPKAPERPRGREFFGGGRISHT